MSDLPKSLSYSSIMPLGFTPDQCNEFKVPPSGGLPTSIGSNDIIIFNWSSERAFIDPYSTYIRLEIEIIDLPNNSVINI